MVYASIIINDLSTSAGSYIPELLAAGGKKEYVEYASTYAIAERKAMHELEHDVSKLDYQVYELDYSVAHATEAKYEQGFWTDAGRYCKSV